MRLIVFTAICDHTMGLRLTLKKTGYWKGVNTYGNYEHYGVTAQVGAIIAVK